MYQIRIRTNKRLDEYGKDDRAVVGVRLKNGNFRYLHWRGFTLDMDRPVKLLVEAFTSDENWDPRRPDSKMPVWHQLQEGEYLVGSRTGNLVKAFLPFRVVK